MDFQSIYLLVDDTLFYYDRKNDILKFGGKYQKHLRTPAEIEHFFEEYGKSMLAEPAEKEKLEKAFLGELKQDEVIAMEVQLLTREKKYELFQIRGTYNEKRDAIIGIIKNIESRRQAITDPLTGLYNRAGLEEFAHEILAHVDEKNWATIYLIDLDNFKQVNDSLGHLYGDELLREVAAELRTVFAKHAIISRIGGDEFVVLIEAENNIFILAERANEACVRITEKFDTNQISISLSIGVAVAKTTVAYDVLFKQADCALYAAKNQGKNGFRFYAPGLLQERYQSDRMNGADASGEINERMCYQYLVEQTVDILNEELTPEETIEKAAKLMVECFDVTRAYASCYVPDGSRIGKSCFYAKDGETNIPTNLELRREDYIKNFNREGIFFCTDVYRVNEPIRSELLRMHVSSFLQLLIYDREGRVAGTIGINASGKKRLWKQQEIDTMRFLARLLTRSVRRLQESCTEETEIEYK